MGNPGEKTGRTAKRGELNGRRSESGRQDIGSKILSRAKRIKIMTKKKLKGYQKKKTQGSREKEASPCRKQGHHLEEKKTSKNYRERKGASRTSHRKSFKERKVGKEKKY